MNEPNLIKKDSLMEVMVKKQKKILILAIMCVITLFIGSSYALLTNFDKTDDVVTFKTGNLNMTVNNTLINLEGKLPESDENGLANATPVTFTLTNTGSMFIEKYSVKLTNDINQTSTLDESYIKYAVSEDGINYSRPSILTTNNNIIFNGYNLELDASKTIYLKVWIDESVGNNALDKIYYASIAVDLYQKMGAPAVINPSDAKFGKIKFTALDNGKGLSEYCVNTNNTDTTDCIWYKAIEGEQITESYVNSSGNYYVHLKDVEGNIGHSDVVEIVVTYNLLDYLENSGTQYIDTGFIPNTNTGVELVYKAVNYTDSQYILGAQSASSTIFYGLTGSASNTIWNMTMGGTPTYSDVTRTGDMYKSKITMSNGSGAWILENLDTNNSTTINFSNMTVDADANLFLFAFNNSNIHANLRIYSCKIYDNDTLVRDYYPVQRISDGIIGLYDVVEDKLYLNEGTDTFNIGEVIGVL